MAKRRFRNISTVWQITGLAVLAVITLGVVLYALDRSIATQTAAPMPKVAFIGDSYTAGNGTSSEAMRWTTRLSSTEGWAEANFGRGGTGYAMDDTTSGVLRPGYSASIADVAKGAPEVVIVSGGRNDALLPIASVTAAVADFYAKLHAALPSAKIIAISPVWDASAPPESLDFIASAVKASAEGVGGTYLDIGQPFKGHPELITDDKVHPNDAGAQALADTTAAALLKSPASSIARG